LAVCRPITAITVTAAARDADQVPDRGGRGEQHGVEPAALDRLADRRGRRRRADRPVRGDVLGLPARSFSRATSLGGDIGPRQGTRLIGSSTLS
jgi:hypothetical protein